MKSIISLCLLGLLAVVFANPEDTYTSKYDGVDVKMVIHNRRLLIAYLRCVLDQGRCTQEGRELKSHVREALEQNCAKCTKAQREGIRIVLKHLINHEPGYWNQLKAKYDKQGKFTHKYERELKELKQ